MAAGSASAMEAGENIVIAGLAVQLLFFGFFIIVSAIFHHRARSIAKQYNYAQPVSSVSRFFNSKSTSWEAMLWCLYAACVLILIRSIFRVVEFVQGNNGWIMRREYLLYVFDAVLMAVQAMLLLIVYPGKVVKRKPQVEGALGSEGLPLAASPGK